MPQPIDMQTELGRITLAERVADVAARLSLAAQQRAQEEAQNAAVAAETQTAQTRETQSEDVDAEARRRNPYARMRRKRAAPERAQDLSGPRADSKGHSFDVTV